MSIRRTQLGLGCIGLWAVVIMAATTQAGQVALTQDMQLDAIIRRTDPGGTGPVDPLNHKLPDLVETRLGRFAPTAPHISLFNGAWNSQASFVRIDLVFDGLMNPPGPLDYGDDDPEYNPMKYGPNPVFGWIEFDVDSDECTGGELTNPQLRYAANVARFGGLPNQARFVDRVAALGSELDFDVTTAPFVDRSGEEFHIALLGENVEHIDVVTESPGGDPSHFESGEVWDVDGDLFHRAHGFEDYAIGCIWGQGRYKPDVCLRFSHDANSDRTTITLVYPLTNAASALMESPNEPIEPMDGCDDNQNSIEEALDDLQFSAIYADPWTQSQPEFQLLAGWEFHAPFDSLSPDLWRSAALVGTAYESMQPGGSRFVWTDLYPEVRQGDFNGDGVVNAADAALLTAFVTANDGDPEIDSDGIASNGQITLVSWASNFALFDTNSDGVIESADIVILGDLDLDGEVDWADRALFLDSLLDPQAFVATHGLARYLRADLSGDWKVDGADIPAFFDQMEPGGPCFGIPPEHNSRPFDQTAR